MSAEGATNKGRPCAIMILDLGKQHSAHLSYESSITIRDELRSPPWHTRRQKLLTCFGIYDRGMVLAGRVAVSQLVYLTVMVDHAGGRRLKGGWL